MRPIAVFRFSPTEGPAHFAQWLDAAGLPWRLVAIDEGQPVPSDARHFAGIGMMGGPMSVTDALAWIDPLSRLLRDAVARDVPVIGHCLGGQLLAQALGARVRRTDVPEIGWIDVESTDTAASDAWFGGKRAFTAFQWHYDAFDVPAGATRVLTNRFNPNQAYVIGDRHIGLQCHIEMTRDLVETWCRTGAGEIAAPGTDARQSRNEILRDLDARLIALQTTANGIYARWAQNLRR
ncbi:MAG TPA: type 1 glutamine amidotransferase [Casimicrobiaceae bacterium]|nr:type 1 glutamine amidotransferase [Casimicrobiaceae bacterium]